jgi:hypothetical protein
MTSIQVAPRDGRIQLSIVVAVVAVAFALGALIGFGLPRIVEGAGHTTGSTVAAAGGSALVRPRDMSDAAYEARIAAAAGAADTVTSVTRPRDMGDAAYDAFHPTSSTMSDAAYDAFHPTTSTMSDAAYAAMHPASNAP